MSSYLFQLIKVNGDVAQSSGNLGMGQPVLELSGINGNKECASQRLKTNQHRSIIDSERISSSQVEKPTNTTS